MTSSDIPAVQIEDYMPPENELKFREDFIYQDSTPEMDVAIETRAGDAPAWMHAAAAAPLPAHDDKADAITIYSEDVTIVLSEGKLKTIVR